MTGRFFTTHPLGPKQSLSPDGYLVCQDVPIARTGIQEYRRGEVPPHIETSPDGVVYVERPEAEVFRPETIASFEGKPVVVDHPGEDVVPANHARLAVGTALNVRRGTGAEDDLLLADLLITRPDAIDAIVNDRLREVSCGYDAEYESVAPGRARQTNIVGNHIALVRNGRCGSRCAIGDALPPRRPLTLADINRINREFYADLT